MIISWLIIVFYWYVVLQMNHLNALLKALTFKYIQKKICRPTACSCIHLMRSTFWDHTQCKPIEDFCCLKQLVCTPLFILFLFQFWSYISLCPSLLCSLSCPSPWRCHSVWQGAKEGVAAQGLHRPGLQHRWRRGWRRHLRLLHPGRRTGWPERRAEEGRPDSLGQYFNLKLPVCQQLQQVWSRS